MLCKYLLNYNHEDKYTINNNLFIKIIKIKNDIGIGKISIYTNIIAQMTGMTEYNVDAINELKKIKEFVDPIIKDYEDNKFDVIKPNINTSFTDIKKSKDKSTNTLMSSLITNPIHVQDRNTISYNSFTDKFYPKNATTIVKPVIKNNYKPVDSSEFIKNYIKINDKSDTCGDYLFFIPKTILDYMIDYFKKNNVYTFDITKSKIMNFSDKLFDKITDTSATVKQEIGTFYNELKTQFNGLPEFLEYLFHPVLVKLPKDGTYEKNKQNKYKVSARFNQALLDMIYQHIKKKTKIVNPIQIVNYY